MAKRSCIPGYDEAIAQERRLREEAFLGDTTWICGIEVRHVTPFLLALLFRMETPFMGRGDYSAAEAIRFLWALSPSFTNNAEARDAFVESALPKIAEIGLESAVVEIETFLDETFFDGPEGGSDSVPYICSIAWMLYKMACEPFKMTREEAGNMPIRQIYQFLKCAKYERGDILYNSISDPLKATWLADLRAGKTTLN